ncbi:MAG: hypothetical protein R3C56_10155 [Pirellulaceae bacterium]
MTPKNSAQFGTGVVNSLHAVEALSQQAGSRYACSIRSAGHRGAAAAIAPTVLGSWQASAPASLAKA